MQCCASCGLTSAVRLYHLGDRGRLRRAWLCNECAVVERELGVDVAPAPVWIERAALNLLPVKELPRRHERRTVVVVDGFIRSDRRRTPRRAPQVAT